MLRFYTRTIRRYMPGGQLLLVEERAQLTLYVMDLLIKWAKKPLTTRKSTAKFSHIAQVQGRLEAALARGERLRA